MSKNKGDKPKYEAPAVLALGELASAVGQSCIDGTNPGGHCDVGKGGGSSCGTGYTPTGGTGQCNCGFNPTGCSNGVDGSPQPADCISGTNATYDCRP